jgi:hypothetical protein
MVVIPSQWEWFAVSGWKHQFGLEDSIRHGAIRIIILDLLQHSFSEARELYADRWLGFSESQLSTMLEKSGFLEIETLIADKEEAPHKFQTLLGIGRR